MGATVITAEYLGIPTLDPALQATEIVYPVMKWGVVKRGVPGAGTIHLYTDDAKFSRLFYSSEKLIQAKPTVAVECNFSTHDAMPRAEAIHRIYKKRLLAAEWQAAGIRIIADLNVEPKFRDLSLLGVPLGWQAFATRIHRGVPFSVVEEDHAQAVAHSGKPDPLFIVFGGGQTVQVKCRERGLIWIPEHRDIVAGRV